MKNTYKRLLELFKPLNKVDGVFSIGEMDKDRYAPVFKDGKETNCRIYLWDIEDIRRLQAIGDNINHQD